MESQVGQRIVPLKRRGDMTKEVYDPNEDAIIAIPQTEADMKESTFVPNDFGIISVSQTIAALLKSIYNPEIPAQLLGPTYTPSYYAKKITFIDEGKLHINNTIGFKPHLILFVCYDYVPGSKNFSIGFASRTLGLSEFCFYNSDSGSYATFINKCLYVRRDSENYMYGEITAFEDYGFDFTTILTGAVRITVRILAIGGDAV